MQRIDHFVLDRICAPVVGFAQHRLGVEKWRLSLECLNGHLAFYIGGTALTVGHEFRKAPVYPILTAALVWLLLMQAVRFVAKRQAGSSIGMQTARMAEWHLRTILVLALPFMALAVRDLDNACYTIALALLAAHFCFKACDTPPPEEKRQRKLAYSRF